MEDRGYNRLDIWLLGDPKGKTPEARLGLLSQKGLSVEKLAIGAGLTRSAIYLYFGDKKRPTEQSLLKICVALNVSYQEGLSYCTPRPAGRPRGTTR